MKRLRVVLVGTQVAANLGSVARALRNFGCDDLALVAPECDPRDERARATATHHADGLLESCRAFDRLEDALADCVLVAGTTARTGGLFRRQAVADPDAVAGRLVAAMAGGPVALVFGPERTGLDNDAVRLCHHLVTVPTVEDYAALNLAQAVAICVYEVRRAWLGRPEGERASVAPFAAQEAMFAQLHDALCQVRYLHDGARGEALMHALRHLIARAGPTPMEVNLLVGLARQLRWVRGHAALPDE